MTALQRQHLIDPEVCIRCNTCEEACPVGAIHHDRRNYVVRFDACTGCGACLPPCPTGAIDSWRSVAEPWTEAQQYAWDALPADAAPPSPGSEPAEVAELSAQASAVAGRVAPPWSAAHPYVGLYSEARPVTATVSGNHRLTAEDATTDIRHLVLDFGTQAFPYLEGQSVGIVPPGVDAIGRPHHVRLYSVASPRDGERPRHNNLALTVKRVTQDHDGRPVHGVASNYLCDLKRGDRVQVTGPWGATFLMPNHPGSNLLMVCTGTGAAPMRAMTERRRRRGPTGELLLFFGARLRGELPYFGPLMKLPPELIGVELAFSREHDTPKQYVQDRMRLQAQKVARLLAHPETYVFLCGHKRMELGVLEAFRDIAAAHALDWPRLLERLKAEGRFHVETY